MIRGPKHPPMMYGHCICGLPEAGSGQRHPCPGLFGNPIGGSFTSGEPKPPNQGWDIRMTYENAIGIDQERNLIMGKGNFRRLDLELADFKTRIESVIVELHDLVLGDREVALAIERLLEAAFWLKQARGRSLHRVLDATGTFVSKPSEKDDLDIKANSNFNINIPGGSLADEVNRIVKSSLEGLSCPPTPPAPHETGANAKAEADKAKRKPKRIRKW